MTPLPEALEKFVKAYHGNQNLVNEQAGWDCAIVLVASDSKESVALQIENGRVDKIGTELEEVDLVITSNHEVLLDILELRRDPNEPYMFGELTIQGPEDHFMRLDYVMTVLCPV